MIEVTFKFDSIEKAIATLGSLMKGAAPVPNIDNPAKPEGVPAGKQRKPRADAGKVRGPYKDNGVATPPAPAEADNAQPSGEVPAEATPPETAAPSGVAGSDPTGESNSEPTVQTAAAAPTATQEQAQAALEALFAAKGLPAAQATMAQFGVSRLRDMKPEDYGRFVVAAQEAAK
jgi:hypothetical protein